MKKSLCLMLTLMVLGLASAPLSAQTVWNGQADISWYDATQTSFDISTPEQLAGVAQLVNSGTSFNGMSLNLTNDIWLNSTGDSTYNWTPIGGASPTQESPSDGNAFKGNFNGHGYRIYNLYCDKTNYFHAGLFGCVENPCTIDSVIVVNPTLKACGMMGTIAGFSRGSGNVYIRYCLVVNANIVGTPAGAPGSPSAGHNNNGGIVGATYPNSASTYIENCGVAGRMSGRYIGGMAGNAERSYLTNCYFAGDLLPLNSNFGGMTTHSGNRTNCYSYVHQLNSQSQSSASSHGTSVSQATMRSAEMITNLGDAFMMDNGINDGYPILSCMRGVSPETAEICNGESVTLTAFGPDYVSYNWGGGNNAATYIVSPSATTTYTVTATKATGGVDYLSATITVHPQADVTAEVMAASDGQVHALVSPTVASVPCLGSDNVTFTVTPDANWRVNRVTLNGAEVYGDIFGEGTATITLNPGGTLGEVKIYLTNTYTITTTLISDMGDTLDNSSLVTPYGNNGVNTVTAGSTVQYAFQNTPEWGFAYALVDGVPVYDSTYDFVDIHADHTIEAIFEDVCGITTLPYTQNFAGSDIHGSGNDAYVYCWDRYASNPSEPVFINTSSAAHSGGKCLKFYDGSNMTTIAIMPKLDESISVNQLQISYWVRRTQSSNVVFELGVMTDKNDPTTFDVVDTPSLGDWALKEFSFENYTGYGQYIAFRVTQGNGNDYMRLDDITLDYIPVCQHPTDLVVDGTTSETVDIHWTEPEYATTWHVEYGPAGFEPGSGTEATAYDTFYTIYGLTPNTEYDVYVWSDCGVGFVSTAISATFRTDCGPIVQLPYVEDFETGVYSTSQDNYIFCWNRSTSDASHYVYVPSNSNAHGGTHFLDFHYTPNCYVIAIAPELDQSIDVSQLMVNFWACHTNSYGTLGTLEVGVMTDKDVDSTFVPVDTINLSGMNAYAYAEQYVNFGNYQGTGKYIAFRVSNCSSCGYYIDDLLIDYAPSCSPVSNLAVSDITGTSAMVAWTPGPFGTVDSYTLEYSETGMESWTTLYNITGTSYLLSGLDFSTDYDVRVMPNCDDLSTGDWTTASFHTKCLIGGDEAIGEGTSTNNYLPSYSFYKYSYTQQLFLSSEMGSPKSIESVTFDMANYAVDRSYKIYLMHTSATSGSSWIDASNAQLVFDTVQSLHAGLNTFNFSQPFEYNGSDNLLLIVMDMTGSYQGSPYNSWRSHTAPFTASRYIYQDGSAYSTASTPSGGTSTTARNNVIFSSPCNNSGCVSPVLSVSDITSDGATVNWVAGYQESAWEMEYRPLSDTNWVSMGTVYSMSEVISGLMPNTAYKVRMRSDCGGGEYSFWTEESFTTACGAFTVSETIPWTEDFETNTTMACFETPVTYTNSSGSTYPKMLLNYGVAAHSGGNSAEFKGTSNMLVLPEFTNDIHDLRMSFWATSWGVTTTAVVGVITDLADTSTFEVLGDAGTPGPRGPSNSTGNGNFMGPFDFNNVQATSGRIAILFSGTTASDAGWNLDDFTVEIIPSCAAPSHTSVTVDNVNENSAEISFTDEDASHTSWIIYYGEAGTTTDTWNSTNVNATTGNILSGLNSNTTYGVYVKTLCGGVEGEDQTNTVTFTTTTIPATLPYTTDFEDATDNPQWVLLNGTQTNKWYIGAPTDSTSVVNTTLDGTNGLYISNNGGASNTYSGSESRVYAYRDIFVPDGTTELLLSFDWKAQGGLYNYEFLRVYWLDPSVVTLSAGSNPPSVGGVNYDAAGQPGNYGPSATEHWLSQQSTWQHKEMLITADQFTGMGSGDRTYRLVFHWRNTYYSSQPPAAVDNIELRAITCATPTGLAVSNVDQNSATVTWTGDASSYGVTIVSANGTDYQTTTTNTLQLTGLTSNTTYQVTVRGYCGADSSMLSQALTFTTACGAITIDATNPWFENFEGYTSSELVCWATPVTHTASNGNVYPRAYLNYGEAAHSGTNTVEFKGASNMLVLPEFTNDIHDLRMSFWSTHWGVTTTVAVGVITDVNDPTTFELLGDAGTPGNRGSAAGGNGNYMGPFDFNGVQATSGRIALLFTGTTASDAGWNLDDFTVELIPACAAPAYNSVTVTNVTENSAEVSFTDNNPAHNAWTIYYGVAGTPTSTWNSVNVTSMTGNVISGLNASTNYGVYVVTLCGGVPGDDQTNIATFTTACGPISVAAAPWSTSFEGTDEQILNCWVSASTGYRNGHTYPHIEPTASIAHGGSSALEVAFGDIVTALPLFVEDLSMLQVSFWAYNNNWSSDNAVLELGYMTDPYDSSTFVSLQSLTDQSYTQTTRTFADLAGLNLPSTTRIAFRFIRPNGSSDLTSWYVDDLEVSMVSAPDPCNVPTGLTVAASGITQTSAVATWTAGGSETTWNVQYKAASASNWTDATANTASYTINGLVANTEYQVRVQADCGSGNASDWSAAVTFMTLPEDTPEPCDVPTGLTVSAVTDESITITWDDNTNVDSWNIQYGMVGGTLSSTTSTTNNYTINGLQPETTYSIQVQANCGDGNVSDWSSAVTGTTTTGIDSWLANSVTLYPNPAREYIDIRVDGDVNVTRMEVYDVYGKLVNTVNVVETPTRINVSGLAAGMYFVRVTTEEGVVTKTFVKR